MGLRLINHPRRREEAEKGRKNSKLQLRNFVGNIEKAAKVFITMYM
jgi:hypothetical protein